MQNFKKIINFKEANIIRNSFVILKFNNLNNKNIKQFTKKKGSKY